MLTAEKIVGKFLPTGEDKFDEKKETELQHKLAERYANETIIPTFELQKMHKLVSLVICIELWV